MADGGAAIVHGPIADGPIVHGVAFSPYVQRVLLAARIKGHVLERRAPLGRRLDSAEHLAVSPLGRIPVLEHGGWFCPESLVIADYLDEVLDGPPLVPGADLRARAHVRLIDRVADLEIGGGASAFFVSEPATGAARETVRARGLERIRRGLAALERLRDPAHDFAAGDGPSLADATLIPFLVFLTGGMAIPGGADLVEDAPGIAAYWRRRLAEPLAAETQATMREGFARFAAAARAAG